MNPVADCLAQTGEYLVLVKFLPVHSQKKFYNVVLVYLLQGQLDEPLLEKPKNLSGSVISTT